MKTIVRKRIGNILKYMVVQQQLGWARDNVVVFFVVFFLFLLSVVIFYTSCVIKDCVIALLKTDA